MLPGEFGVKLPLDLVVHRLHLILIDSHCRPSFRVHRRAWTGSLCYLSEAQGRYVEVARVPIGCNLRLRPNSIADRGCRVVDVFDAERKVAFSAS